MRKIVLPFLLFPLLAVSVENVGFTSNVFGDGNVYTFDPSNPSSAPVARVNVTGSDGITFSKDGSIVYFAASSNVGDVYSFPVAGPYIATPLNTGITYPISVAVSNDGATGYATVDAGLHGGTPGLYTFPIGGGSGTLMTDLNTVLTNPTYVAIKGDQFYVGGYTQQPGIFNIELDSPTTYRATQVQTNSVSGIAISGDHLYFSTYIGSLPVGIYRISLSDPGAMPEIVTSSMPAGYVDEIAISADGETLFFGVGSVGVYSIPLNSTFPQAPVDTGYSFGPISIAIFNPSAEVVATNNPIPIAMPNSLYRILYNLETSKHLEGQREQFLTSNHSNLFACNTEIAQEGSVQQMAGKPLKRTLKPWSFYLEPLGSFGHLNPRKGVVKNTFETVGGRVGFDYMWDRGVCYGLGFLGEYTHLWDQVADQMGRFTVDEAYGSLYGTVVPGTMRELSFNAIVGGGYSWYNTDRYPLSDVKAVGHTGGANADVFVDVEYVFRHERFNRMPKNLRVTPIGALQYTYTNIDSYTEKNASLYNLKVKGQNLSALASLLGFRTSYLFFADSPITVRPELMAQWQYQLVNPSMTTKGISFVTLTPSESIVTVPGFAPNSLIAGADLRIEMYDKAMIQLNYDFLYNEDFLTNFFLLEMKGHF